MTGIETAINPAIHSEIHEARQVLLAGDARRALAMLLLLEHRETPGGLLEHVKHAVWDSDDEAATLENFATFRLVRAECHYALKDYRHAVEDLRHALILAPNSPRAELLMRLAGEMLDLDRAIRPVRSGLESYQTQEATSTPEPTVAEIPVEHVAEALLRERATKSSSVTEGPEETGLVSETLANIMALQGKFEEARKVYIQLARQNPDRFDHYRAKIDELERLIGQDGR